MLLWLQNKGFRYTEAIIVTLVTTIAVCFGIQVIMSRPDLGSLAVGLVPTTRFSPIRDALHRDGIWVRR